MKTKSTLITSALALTTLLFSCKKEEAANPQNNTTSAIQQDSRFIGSWQIDSTRTDGGSTQVRESGEAFLDSTIITSKYYDYTYYVIIGNDTTSGAGYSYSWLTRNDSIVLYNSVLGEIDRSKYSFSSSNLLWTYQNNSDINSPNIQTWYHRVN